LKSLLNVKNAGVSFFKTTGVEATESKQLFFLYKSWNELPEESEF
jgi:hypothetical protein